jgi:hypothetical protein
MTDLPAPVREAFGGDEFNVPSTFTFRLAPDAATIQRMTITA